MVEGGEVRGVRRECEGVVIPGATIALIVDAILDAFNLQELTYEMRVRMDVVIANVVAPGPFRFVVFELVTWGEGQGRLEELVRVVADARPAKPKMQDLRRRVGLSTAVAVRTAGVLLAGGPTDDADRGLEAVIRPTNPALDYEKLLETLGTAAQRVCRITIARDSAGTGFLVGPQAVLTNHHVVRSIIAGGDPAEVRCEFDYSARASGVRPVTPVALDVPRWLIDSSAMTSAEAQALATLSPPPTSEQLDYALMRLVEPFGDRPALRAPGAGSPPRGWFRVPRAEPTYFSPMPIVILQHPDGRPLKIAIDTHGLDRSRGYWFTEDAMRLRYATNTEPGASGSPCIDLAGQLLAIHHYGDGGSGERVPFNQGIPIAAIRRRLDRDPAIAAMIGD